MQEWMDNVNKELEALRKNQRGNDRNNNNLTEMKLAFDGHINILDTIKNW